MEIAIKFVLLLLVITLVGYLATRDMEKQTAIGWSPSSGAIKLAWFAAIIGGSTLIYSFF